MKFKEARKLAEQKGWQLEKLTGDTNVIHRYRHYKTGYVVLDGQHSHRWQTLGDFVFNCLENNRWIDGFKRRY